MWAWGCEARTLHSAHWVLTHQCPVSVIGLSLLLVSFVPCSVPLSPLLPMEVAVSAPGLTWGIHFSLPFSMAFLLLHPQLCPLSPLVLCDPPLCTPLSVPSFPAVSFYGLSSGTSVLWALLGARHCQLLLGVWSPNFHYHPVSAFMVSLLLSLPPNSTGLQHWLLFSFMRNLQACP